MSAEKRYAQQIAVGESFSYGEYTFTEENIISFAQQYDPQDFHLDPEAALQSPIGVFCASALHLLSIVQRLNVEHVYDKCHMVAGRSIDKLRLLQPTVPGDCISVELTIEAIKLYPSMGRGLVGAKCIVVKKSGQRAAQMYVEFLVVMAPTEATVAD